MEYFWYFILGLGLNLTPCVYPMLTITLSVFRGSKEESRWKAFWRSFLYVMGIIVMYTVLGLSAAFSGQLLGSLLQNFWILLLISFFIFVLSLSMLGAYTFRLPSWMIPQEGISRRSALGLFLSGVLVGVIAAPCIGPVVLSMLAHISQEHSPILGAASFFMLSLGLGMPYLILGTFTGLLKKLPQSGAWLIWFERFLGVVLFTFGCFYLIIAFRWPFLPWLIPLACLGGGIYLGWIEHSAKEVKAFSVFQKITGTLLAVGGLVMMLEMASFHPKEKVIWENYHTGILDTAKTVRQPVILDFFADWCIPCHELDRFTYTNPSVINVLKSFRRIKVDATSMHNEGVVAVARQFDVMGVPTIVFLDEQGREVPELRMEGYVPPEDFVNMLRFSRLWKFVPLTNPQLDKQDGDS